MEPFQCNGTTQRGTRCKVLKRVSSQEYAYCKRHDHTHDRAYSDSAIYQGNRPLSLLEERMIELTRKFDATADTVVYIQRHFGKIIDDDWVSIDAEGRGWLQVKKLITSIVLIVLGQLIVAHVHGVSMIELAEGYGQLLAGWMH